jgi:hypothetical protein
MYTGTIRRALPGFRCTFRRGHFFISGFAENLRTGKLVYFSCSDVRFFPDRWYSDILIRTAESTSDFTGGRNHSCTLETIREVALTLTQ